MAVYIVTGKLGSGKTLATVGRIRDALLQGRRIATNLDLNLDKLINAKHGKPEPATGTKPIHQKIDCIRLPDKPSVDDLESIGMGCEEINEERHGLIVLDELGTWLNTRSWADKNRQAVIDWLLHSRKKGWDVYFIIQSVTMIDKQVREGVAEYHAPCKRLDRIRIPFIGSLLSFVGIKSTLPKIHVSNVRYGLDRDALLSDRWVYRGHDLYAGYDTRQTFTDAQAFPYSYLTPWHTKGRHQMKLSLISKFLAGYFKNYTVSARLPLKPKKLLVNRIMKLPPEQRMEFFNRFRATGAI